MRFIRKIFSKKVTTTVLIVFLISIFIAIPNAFFYTLNSFSHAPDEINNIDGVLGVTDSSAVEDFPYTNGEVYATRLSEDGKTLYIGGSFTSVTDSAATYSRNYLAAINLETLTVTSWDPNPNYYVYAVAVVGTDIYVGGDFGYFTNKETEEEIERKGLAKIDGLTAEIDDGCICNVLTDPNQAGSVYSLYSDNTYLYVGGSFDVFCGSGAGTYNNLGRISLSSCTADNGWNPKPNNTIYSIDGDGSSVFVGGAFSEIGGVTRNEFAKLSSSDGSADTNCNPNFWTDTLEGTSTVYAIDVETDYIYVGGSFDKYGGSEGTSRNEIARLNNNSSCSLDIWNPNISYSVFFPVTYSIKTSGSDVFAGGSFSSLGSDERNGMALINSSTGIAGVWNPNFADGYVKDIVFSDEYLIVGGYFQSVGGLEVANLVAFPYTPPVSIQDNLITTPASSSNGPEVIQIPEMTTNLQGPVVINPVKDSNTGGEEVIAVVFPGVFNFDAYFSANMIDPKNIALGLLSSTGVNTTGTSTSQSSVKVTTNTVFAGGGDSTILGVKKGGIVFWQVGGVQEMWLKAYPAPGHDAPKIIPEIQEKNSIIALKYKKSDLIPPGFPKTKFNELKLKIAHSLDGKTWTTLPTSVVDPITNTVAAIGKIGGYYMIVGGY